MGQSPSSPFRARGGSHTDERRSSQLKERLQVLEDLVQGTTRQRRQEQLRELTADSAAQPTNYSILPRAPEEFKLGYLIAAGSYGRIYAGSYRGRPAALKLLILEEDSAADILNEVRLCLKLNHRNLVRLLDCAVVSTSMRQFPGSRSTADGASAGWWYSSEQQGYNYLPMMAGQQQDDTIPAGSRSNSQQPFMEVARASSLEDPLIGVGSDMSPQDYRPGLGLTSASGHACYEVWIAMELCDGGTLAEQVQQGFQYCPGSRQVDMELLLTVALDIARALLYMHSEHVCHGDLKAENVLLKVLGDDAASSSHCNDSSSECSWLQVLCHNTSSSNITSRGRRASYDSFWSFAKSISPKGGTVDSSSSDSSTGVLAKGRQGSPKGKWRSSRGLLSLANLCCGGSAAACVSKQDADHAIGPDQNADECSVSAGCIPCGSLPTAVTDTGQQQQQDADNSGSSVISCSTDVAAHGQLHSQGLASPTALVAPVVVGTRSAGAAEDEPASPTAQFDSGAYSSSTHIGGAQQPAEHNEPSSPQLHAADETSEEEHIAPLSLYSTMREQRRSRRLSSTALSVQAALAAAAAAGLLDATLNSGKLPYNNSSNSSGDTNNQLVIDEEVAVTNESAGSASSAGSQQQQKQQGSWSAVGSASGQRLLAPVRTGHSQELPGWSFEGADQLTRANSSPEVDKMNRGAAAAFVSSLAARGQRSHGRSRRHSYCYGSSSAGYSAIGLSGASSYDPPTSQLRQQYTCSHARVSAAEAAAAIAAAADAAKAARDESQLALRARLAFRNEGDLSASGSRRHRSRRMSCDDRLLQHMSSTTTHATTSSSSPYLGGRGVIGQGRLPLALRRTGSSGADSPVRAAAAAATEAPAASKRRHSWTSAYLEGAMEATAAAQYLRDIARSGIAKCLTPSEQRQQQQQCERRLSLESEQQSAQLKCPLLPENSNSSNSSSAAEDSKQQRPSWQQRDGVASSRGRRRRHSWAGFFADQQPLIAAAGGGGGGAKLPAGKPSPAQRLSACFSTSDMAVLEFDPVTSPQTSKLATLASFVGCCGDATRSTLVGDSFSTDVEARQLLLSEFQHSSVDCPVDLPPADAADVGCKGRSGQRSSSSKSSGSRRRSWCCGTTATDVVMFLGVESGSSNDAELLRWSPATGLGHSVGVSPQGKARRQSSWDDAHYRALDEAAALAPSSVAASPRTASSSMSSTQSIVGGKSAVPNRSAAQQQSGSSCAFEGVAAKSALLAPTSTSLAADQTTEQHQQQPTNSNAGSMQHISMGAQQGSTTSGTGTTDTAEVAAGRPAGIWDSSQVAQQLRVGTSDLACAPQVSIQLTCTPLSPNPTSPASAQQLHSPGAGSTSSFGLDRDLPLELFTGSFDCKQTDGSSRRSSSSIVSTANAFELCQDALVQQQLQHGEKSPGMVAQESPPAAISSSQLSSSEDSNAAAVFSSKGSFGGRERRWSTGVAAHDLLTRQQGISASGVKARRASTCIPNRTSDVLEAVPSGISSSASARAEPPLRHEQSPVMSGSLATGRSNDVNVLGMPRTPASVLAQRRMSYDAATGAYTMIDQAALDGAKGRRRDPDSSHLQKVVQPQHPNSQEHLQQSLGAQQDQQQQESDQQPPDYMQQRMQRLLEALGKRGYAGIEFDNNSRSASPTQQQQQQIGPSVAPAAASAPVASAAASAADSAARSPSPHCVPPAYSRPKYCAKVCDFGFSQRLRAGQSHCSTLAAGTLTHQAPEVLKSGYLSPAADIYAFGIILWELLTGERPFRGLLEGDLIGGVCEQGLRPQFPPGAPEAYVALAQQCWAESIADRPTARQLLKRLNEMLYEVRRHKQLDTAADQRGASGGTAPSSRPRRHSMPAVGGGRQRRLSRRLSQFLPFGRPPVTVPENAPLDQIPAAAEATGLVSDSDMTTAAAPPAVSAVAVTSRGSTPAGAPASTAEGGNEWFQSFD